MSTFLSFHSTPSLGEGEPDMDFAAIDKTMKLKAFNLNEFCLCTANDDALPPPPPPPPVAGPVANRPVSVRSMPYAHHGVASLNRKSPPPPMILESFVSEKSIHTPGMLSRQESFVTVSAMQCSAVQRSALLSFSILTAM
jgi:hypothetical protein